jgi:hypothetical protein
MPSVEWDAIDSTPMPYLPAICIPDGEIDDAVTIGMSSWIGSSWSSQSCNSNHSHSYENRGSPRSRRMMTPRASSCRSRRSTGSMPNVRASDGSAPGPEPNIARPRVRRSSWTMRWATLNGW